jgi:hypothetical protein
MRACRRFDRVAAVPAKLPENGRDCLRIILDARDRIPQRVIEASWHVVSTIGHDAR